MTPCLFFDSLRGKTVAFMGLGVTNNDTIKLFAREGVRTLACDRRAESEFDPALLEGFRALGVELRLGEGYFDRFDMDVIFRAPGMYFNLPRLREFRGAGGVVTSEMEVFFELCPCRTIAVTGSEGKTTTSTLISEILGAAGHTVHLGGNIGKALLPAVFEIKPEDFAVVELSSFQLLSMRQSPDTAVITNITPDHLDVHKDMDEYVNAKRNLYLHQNAFSRTVLNADNALTASFLPEVRGEAMAFSLERPVEHGAYYRDGVLYLSAHGEARPVVTAEEIRLPGMHNAANFLAAICATAGLADTAAHKAVAAGFGGVEHRLEFVREINGVRWYNDSIATAPAGVVAGLRAFDRKLIIIGGGSDKNIGYDAMAADVIERVKLLILTGPTGPKIAAAITANPAYRQGSPEIVMAGDIPEAVRIASERAAAGDIVSLSPASASFNAYRNFEERGRHFKELVRAL